MVKNDLAFYQAVNQSLDMTIDRLGRAKFDANLAQYRKALALIQVILIGKPRILFSDIACFKIYY